MHPAQRGGDVFGSGGVAAEVFETQPCGGCKREGAPLLHQVFRLRDNGVVGNLDFLSARHDNQQRYRRRHSQAYVPNGFHLESNCKNTKKKHFCNGPHPLLRIIIYCELGNQNNNGDIIIRVPARYYLYVDGVGSLDWRKKQVWSVKKI